MPAPFREVAMVWDWHVGWNGGRERVLPRDPHPGCHLVSSMSASASGLLRALRHWWVTYSHVLPQAPDEVEGTDLRGSQRTNARAVY